MALLFNSETLLLKASESLLQHLIVTVESNNEFIISANVKVTHPTRESQSLFSVIQTRSRLTILDVHTKGLHDNMEVGMRYRTSNDQTNLVSFRRVPKLGDGEWHKVYLHIVDTNHRFSMVSLYVDCEPVGVAQQTTSPISSVFSYEGTRLSRMTFRIAQRGAGNSVHSKWQVGWWVG